MDIINAERAFLDKASTGRHGNMGHLRHQYSASQLPVFRDDGLAAPNMEEWL